ncbi:MAG: amidohydrolase family protein [Clostridiales bacterium]|nr:amidohydrolase family protein [Clostridiales bacterium]
MIIYNAQIYTMESEEPISDGYVIFDRKKILEIGTGDGWQAFLDKAGKEDPDLYVRRDFAENDEKTELLRTIDAKGARLYPGFIDAHSHLGLFDDGLTDEGSDGNEIVSPISPDLRAIDGMHNGDPCFREAKEGGVTLVAAGPGSANIVGGQFALVKTYEKTIDRALVDPFIAMKAALGENPKMCYGKENKAPQTRMGNAALLRGVLSEAIEYYEKKQQSEEKWAEYNEAVASAKKESSEGKNGRSSKEDKDDKPERPDVFEKDLELEAMIPVILGQKPLKIHAHRQDDILTAVRIANEFRLKYTLDHCTEGHLIADVLKEEYEDGKGDNRGKGIFSEEGKPSGGKLLGIIVGPVIGDRSKPELSNLNLKTAGILEKEGLPVAIMTDHPCVPEQYLPLSAALAKKGGMSEQGALEAVTIRAAEILGVSDRYGSLSEGKAPDLVLMSGSPLSLESDILLVIGSGRIVADSRS